MKNFFSSSLCFLTIFVSLSSCHKSLPIRDEKHSLTLQFFEYALESDNNVDRQFHVAAAANLQVPGYIIGVEKAHKRILGFSRYNLASETNKYDYYDMSSYWGICGAHEEDLEYKIVEDEENNTRRELIDALTNNDKVTYVSHINKYSYAMHDNPQSNVINEYLYNSYSCKADANHPICRHLSFRKKNRPNSCIYNAGWKSILTLKDVIQKDLNQAKAKRKPYSHIIVYSMGWNTVQRAAIQNFNFLQGNLIRLAKSEKKYKDFNPLMIGITWPSDWALEDDKDNMSDKLFRPTKRAFSFFTKRQDADEVGSMWGNILLQQTLLPLKEKNENLRLVLVGHSFGTRVITNSVFSAPIMSDENKKNTKVDLVVGLQGAFPITRFIKGDEKYTYQNIDQKVNKMVYTWSPYDSANKIISSYIGGQYGHDYFAQKNPEYFEFAAVDSCGMVVQKDNLKKPDFDEECLDQSKHYRSKESKNKILYVDASKLINHQVEGGAGGSHSDLYHDGVSRFILNNIYDYTME